MNIIYVPRWEINGGLRRKKMATKINKNAEPYDFRNAENAAGVAESSHKTEFTV